MKAIYKDNIIESLEDLADYNTQKIAWFDNDQGLMYSFDENVDDLFENSILNDLFAEGEIVFRELQRACLTIPDKLIDTKEFVDSVEMAIIREMAKRCLDLVNETDGAESTVMYLKPGDAPPNS